MPPSNLGQADRGEVAVVARHEDDHPDPVGARHLGQGSDKWGRWGRIFPDKAKSHGQFGPKTTYKTDRQTDRHYDTDRQSEDRQKDTQTD